MAEEFDDAGYYPSELKIYSLNSYLLRHSSPNIAWKDSI